MLLLLQGAARTASLLPLAAQTDGRRPAAQPDVVACARRRRDGVAPSLKPGAAGRPSGAA